MSKLLTFEILALDPKEQTLCDDAESLLYAIRSYSALWNKSASINKSDCQIKDGDTLLTIIPVELDKNNYSATDSDRSFIVALRGFYDYVEPLRELLTGFLKEQQNFSLLYVVRDEVSEEIACKLYPYLYRIENLLRGYLIKFMSIRIGPGWWENTVPKEIIDKARRRRGNETVFGKHVENSAYLIDFGELGEIVYKQTSGFVTKEDIIKRIEESEITEEALKMLKEELQSNYKRFFKQSFADRKFSEKWGQFEKIRNKIAHNNLFTAGDLEQGESLAKEIEDMITEADKQTPQIHITPGELEAIQDSIAQNSESWEKISEDELLKQLQEQESRYKRTGGFVGIAQFVKTHLGGLGYNFGATYNLIEKLEKEEKVETYSVENLNGEHPVTAIRLIQ